VEFGDKILKYVGNKINNIAKKHNISTVYRLGADDFGILAQKEKCKILEYAKEIINYFENNEIDIDGTVVNISVSIGISDKYPYLENADIALKNAKMSHRENIVYFIPEMDFKNKILQNIQKTNILYEALKDNRVVLYFQPIVNKDGKAIKYEVLSRVIHKNGKVESIFPYLEVAKESRLYQKITLKVLEESYEFLQKNRVNLSLNLSIEDILDDTIQQTIEKLFFNKDIASYITFELLESEAIEDYELVEKFIKKVKFQNMQVAIDDFGSGYSNFEHILNLNVDILKIDGSLIKNIAINENAKKIVKTINMFAKECKITTVAEYVSDEEIFNIVKEFDIDMFQGSYFSEPKPNIK
jgi:EAL domain-containing protein (putative c-di-GMP-specific phosphodiesterase class I)